MNSHVVLKLGVAYKANLKHIAQVIIFSVVFSGIITMTNSLPTSNELAFHKNKNNSVDMFPIVPGERPVPELYLFLHANNNMWLEILPDGRVKSNTCPTKYGALRTGSHSSESLLKGKNFRVKSGAAVFLKGVVSQRYLCVTKDGQVYSSRIPDLKDCLFVQKPKIETNGSHVHYFKHLHYKTVYKTKKRRNHKTVRFQLGFYDNGTVFVVQRHTQRRKENKPMISINKSFRTMPSLTECKFQIDIPKPKLRFKFCRRVWRNFFNASVKDLRRFRKYNCWDKLRRRRKIDRTQNKDDSG